MAATPPDKTFIPKLDASLFAIIGAKDASEFSEKFTVFIQGLHTGLAAANEKIAALETSSAAVGSVTPDQVRVIAKEEVTTASAGFMVKIEEASKSVASRIAVEAIGAVGGAPVRPSPAPAVEPENKATNLIAAGKFEEAWAVDKKLQEEFPDAGCYAAFAKAASEGRVTVNQPK